MTRSLILALALLGSTAAIAGDTSRLDENIVGKVAVFQNSQVTFNGKTVTLEQLKKNLETLKEQNGEVWYYREDPKREPPAIATQVIQAIIDNNLPVTLSTKPDYSTVVLPDGTVKPRVRK